MEEIIKDTVVTLLDENNQEVSFDVLLTFDYEGHRYVALLPMEDVEGVGEDEVIILEDEDPKGGKILKPIENPVLLEEVFNEFLELFDEEVEEEDMDEA